MYERFTDRARKVMQLANKEAQRFNHEYIGTEHILLGLVKEGSGVAANVLKNLDIDLRKIRLEVEKIVQSGPDMVTMGTLPQTPRAKKVIEYAVEESINLNHNWVGTEHLLLGLVREEEGVASQVLINLGLRLSDVRREIPSLLGHSAGKEVPRFERTTEAVYIDEFELHVPLTSSNGQPIAPDKLVSLRQRWVDQFGGVRESRYRIDGTWKLGAVTLNGDVVVYSALSALSAEALAFFDRLREELQSDPEFANAAIRVKRAKSL